MCSNPWRAGWRALALVAVLMTMGGCVSELKDTDGGVPDGGSDADGGGSACTDPLLKRTNLCAERDSEAVKRAQQLLAVMNLEDKVQQMSGPAYNPNNMFDQPDNDRLGIPGHKFMDGPRGVRWYNSDYGTTVFPVAAARASSWDLELERQIGKVMGDEMRYLGRHVLLAPTVNQVMHPRWGRAQETYGEDTHLLGMMAAAFISGAQAEPSGGGHRVQACVKHLAANNIEDTRIFVNAVLDERTLREVYLPHFRKAVDAGVACVMASYNRVNGDHACYSAPLLRDVLKTEWGFQGYVISDWFAKGLTVPSAAAGLDVEMPFSSGPFPEIFNSQYFYGAALVTAVNDGKVSADVVDEAALRVLHRKAQFGVLDATLTFSPEKTKSQAAQQLALQSAREGIVLLKNGAKRELSDDVLPLDATKIKKVAVVGLFANLQNTGDKGSSEAKVGDPDQLITPFEGIRDAFSGGTTITEREVAGNEDKLKDADVIVVVAAYYFADLARSASGEEGEWKDRASMELPPRDRTNIADALKLKAQNPNLKVIVVVKSGGAVVGDWIDQVDGLIMAWYAGMQEGTALAEILFGKVNPSGKVCQSFPLKESDLPAFDSTITGDVEYDYYHGYRYLDKQGKTPRYAFGFGLSYTTFQYSNLKIDKQSIDSDGELSVTVDVKNSGTVAGSEVVQLYVGYENTSVDDRWRRPVKELKAFTRLADIAPGATKTATLKVAAKDLAYWDTAAAKWAVEKMDYELYVGPSAQTDDTNMQKGAFSVK
ncbi:MAG: glycoside hydrolase family 3 C-terminal domain-containing protein [Myxococcales bacterium]|nr:glycoside hydrolase family 3 C-terminal domain-containing protein [Myxococcales bacterium]